MRTLRVRLHRPPVLTVRRTNVTKDRLVYLIAAARPQRYRYGRSRVVYVGTTRTGLGRIAASAAHRAGAVLKLQGVREFDVVIVTCQGRPGVQTWRKLERALILCFRGRYGDVPALNKQGERIRKRDEFCFFRQERLEQLLQNFEP